MRKYISLLCAAVLLLSLSACKKSEDDNPLFEDLPPTSSSGASSEPITGLKPNYQGGGTTDPGDVSIALNPQPSHGSNTATDPNGNGGGNTGDTSTPGGTGDNSTQTPGGENGDHSTPLTVANKIDNLVKDSSAPTAPKLKEESAIEVTDASISYRTDIGLSPAQNHKICSLYAEPEVVMEYTEDQRRDYIGELQNSVCADSRWSTDLIYESSAIISAQFNTKTGQSFSVGVDPSGAQTVVYTCSFLHERSEISTVVSDIKEFLGISMTEDDLELWGSIAKTRLDPIMRSFYLAGRKEDYSITLSVKEIDTPTETWVITASRTIK